MKYLILDTSSMLFGFSNGKNLFEISAGEFPRYRQIVSKGIVNELEGISKNRGKRGACARLALAEIRAKKIDIDNINEADHWILGKAGRSRDSIVVTNDTALARGLMELGVKVLKLSRSGILKVVW